MQRTGSDDVTAIMGTSACTLLREYWVPECDLGERGRGAWYRHRTMSLRGTERLCEEIP